MNESVVEVAGRRLPEVVHRVSRLEPSAALAHLVITASATSPRDAMARENGRLLVNGILQDREAESNFVIRSLQRLGETEMRALVALQAALPMGTSEEEDRPSQRAMLAGVVDEAFILPVLNSLRGAGCIRLDPPGFGGWYWTELGRRLAVEISEAEGSPAERAEAPPRRRK